MAYTKFEYDKTKWQNKSDGMSTPIGKKNLNHIEDGIYGTAEALDEAYRELNGNLSQLSEEIIDIVDAIKNGFVDMNKFHNGKISASTGAISESNNNIYSDYFVAERNQKLVLTIPNYSMRVFKYDEEGKYKGYFADGNWNKTIIFDDTIEGYNLRLHVTNTTEFIPSDMKNGITTTVPSLYEYYNLSDVEENIKNIKSDIENIKGKNIVFYVNKNGSGDYTNLVEALDIATQSMDSTVYVGSGTYDIYEDCLEYYGSNFFDNYSNSNPGIVLKNRIRVVFSTNAKVIYHYTGNVENVLHYFSPFNSGEYGFTIEGLILSASRCRYPFHDERNAQEDDYVNIFKNCDITSDNSNNAVFNLTRCISGGLGKNGRIIIDGCKFHNGIKTNSRTPLVSYHNSKAENAHSSGQISNCYFDDNCTFKMTYYGSTEQITEFICNNNRMGAEPYIDAETTSSTIENVKITSWGNEIVT